MDPKLSPELADLLAAYAILNTASTATVLGPKAVWTKVYNAMKYINAQVALHLADPDPKS